MESKQPRISVIVPVHNGQAYLKNCIESVEAQSYGRRGTLEVIIVNDGSTDDTGRICGELTRSYDNVRIVTLQDEGVSAARNAGIRAAQGELLTFVDADDRLLPETLQVLYDCLTETGSDVAGCRFFAWSTEKTWRQAADQSAPRGAGQEKPIVCYTPREYLRDAILCGNSRCWSKLYRRETVEQTLFQEGLTIGEDMLFLVRMLPFVHKIVETEYPGYGYFRNPAGTINRAFTPGYMDQIACWQLAREEVLRIAPELDAQVTALAVIGIMLTAGKLALLPAPDRRLNRRYVRICHEKLREALRTPGAYGRLPAGYRAKAGLYLIWPGLYLQLYRLQKSVRRKNEE